MSAPIHEMPLRKAALASFLAMCVSDLISTALVVYQSHYNAVAAGVCDVLGYLAALVCSVLAIDSILRDGWRNRRSLVLIGVITCANWCGTFVGVVLLAHLTRR